MFKYIIALIILLALLLVGVTVGANNDQIITFNYIIAQTDIQLSTLVAILFGIGLILGWLISSFFYVKLRLKHMALTRQLKRQMNVQKNQTQTNTTAVTSTPKA
ncbi:hypothetical protein A6A19_03585 [Actinobacillus delphinicola]|uniref:Probable lipopolysaccharide assembly protein A n=1 Tax=Actinobacillus delphinicola TaxID=51161 RepID=A0A448TSE9_9PAST|nr:lipopolysaccharide assembly protein LapA domain-containing protein [Actinobacillus delphinicola]MDG6897105.1 hypothetical protein [Actinobacillus delphinicola]VEJ08922.1 30S ribosomal protein S1 [Actinobacillus delphinicola]